MFKWTQKVATIDSRRIPYLDGGDPASPHVIVLVHAFPVGMRMWEALTLPPGWRGVAPALPGFDGTEAPGEGTSLDDYARATIAFMDHLHIDKAFVAGVSMGGYVAFSLWRLARLRCRGLVLADTRAGADTEQARIGRQKLLEVVKQHGVRGVADEMLPKLLGETTRRDQPQLVDHVRRLIERQNGDGIAAAVVRLRDRQDSTPLLDQIDVPVLVIVGNEDIVTPPSESEQMHRRLENARLVRVHGAGHLSCLENPVAFNAALAGFLSASRG